MKSNYSTFWSVGRVALLVFLSVGVLTACSTRSKRPDPTPLAPVTALVPASLAWNASIGPMDALSTPVVQGSTLFVANAAGVVTALNAANGQILWRVDTRSPMSAGVGSDGQTVALVTRDNDLVAVRSGGEQWRVRLGARVFTAPLVAGERVFVLAGDRSVSAFDAATGAQLWTQAARGTDPLVLMQSGVITAVGDTLLVGVGGRLVALDPLNGRLRWDAAIATPRGVNEIERLVDLVGRVGLVGDQVCVRAFQAAVGCVDASRGRLDWVQPANGAVGLHSDQDRVSGVERDWFTDTLLHRGVTAPLAAGRSIVVGDAQGFVHLLSRENGSLLNRLSTDGSPIIGGPLLAGNTLIAVTRNGGVFGWRPE